MSPEKKKQHRVEDDGALSELNGISPSK